MSDTNDNFQDLKQLLKLKRHEIPPPGYFNRFSGDVISRIRAGEAGGQESFIERLQSDSPFWSNLLYLFNAKPGIIGGMAICLCLLLLLGALMADRTEPATAGTETTTAQAASPMPEATPTLASAGTLGQAEGGITVNTNPVVSLQPVPTMFGSPQNPLFQTAGFVQPVQ